ncbi:MAG TPA: DUF4446 family protein [Actinomycetota bacterium]|jgi:hypothetical protein
MTIPPTTLSILVIVALGVAALALLIAIASAARRRPKARPSSLPIQLDDVLRGILEGHARALQRLEAAVRQLANEDVALGERLTGAVQRVALIRYDAFEDVGGRLSFSCALLDDRGDGVVMTSINGRQDTRVYAKPVHAGTSDHNLSEEEVEAIREALGAPQAPRQAVEAG